MDSRKHETWLNMFRDISTFSFTSRQFRKNAGREFLKTVCLTLDELNIRQPKVDFIILRDIVKNERIIIQEETIHID